MPGKHDPAEVNKVATEEVTKAAPIYDSQKVEELLGIKEDIPYVQLDAFIGNPYALLGSVIEVRKIGGVVPASIASGQVEFSAFTIPGIKVDPASKLGSPLLRQSIVVDQGIAGKVAFLNYLSAEMDASSVFSVMAFDHSMGLVDRADPSWKAGVDTWRQQSASVLTDPEVCFVFAVIGFVEKQIVRKKFVKWAGTAQGGAFGLTVNGAVHTSTEEYALDIRFGLTPVILKRPAAAPVPGPTVLPAPAPGAALAWKPDLTPTEGKLFGSITAIKNKMIPR